MYFAAVSSDEIGGKLHSKVEAYGATGTITSSVTSRIGLAYRYYFGQNPDGLHATSQVLRGGEQGELAEIRVNHSRSLVNTLLNLIIGPKVVWTPKATNRDYESLKETALASAILEYYWTERQLARYTTRALEEAIVFTEGFVFPMWDEALGEDTQADPEDPSRILKGGDISFRNVSSWDVIRDPTKQSWDHLDWVMIRLWRSKWDVAAEHPEFADLISTTPADVKLPTGRSGMKPEDCDDIAVYYFFHKRTAAVPDGRQTIFTADKTVLSDSILEYDEIPLYRVSPAEMIGTPYGYSAYMEILGIQELMDSLQSSIASNQTTFGTPNIILPEGTTVEEVTGGMRGFYLPTDSTQKPEALQLCATPPELFAHVKNLEHDQEMLMGLNSVVRGTLPGGSKEMSGSALVLLQAQALQQSSVLQGNYLRLIESLGTCVIRILQKRATQPRKVDLVGKQSRYLVDEAPFTNQSIGRIKKVTIEIGNPLSQTSAGRLEMAKMLLSTPGLAEKLQPEQLEQVLSTGRMEPLTHSTQDELMLILSENEDISNGITPPALVHDDAIMHCREHRSTIASPNARKNPKVLKAAMDHIHTHYAAYYGVPLVPAPPPVINSMTGMPIPPEQMPPHDQFMNVKMDPLYRDRMLFLMGFPPTPPGLMMLPPPPGMGPPPGPGGPGPGGPPPEPKGSAPPPAPKGLPNGVGGPKPPAPPKNPSSGQRWSPQDGGMPGAGPESKV